MQTYLFQCYGEACVEPGHATYVFESSFPKCPKCDAVPPEIGTLVAVHYGYYDPKGKLKGYKNRKLSVACGTSDWSSPHSCISAYLPLVNCVKCKESEIYKNNWFTPDFENSLAYLNNPAN